MDTKEIVERVLKGEDYSTLVKELPDDKKIEVGRAVQDVIDSNVKGKLVDLKKATEDIISVRKGIDDIKAKQAEGVDSVLDTFKKEQIQKAKRKFFSDSKYPVTPEQKIQIENELTARGVQSTDADFVFDEIKKIYGALNVDNLIADKEKATKGAAGAAAYNRSQAGGSNSGPTGDPDKYSAAVRELHQKVVESGHKNFSLDQAKELFDKGRIGNRNFSRSLS